MDANKMVSNRLIILAKSISVDEKVEAMELFGISRPTVDKYLCGDVSKVDLATNLVQFFAEKVKHRMEIINEAWK